MFEMLPKQFKPKELAPLCKSLNISKRTAERMLDKLKKAGRLTSVKKGEYEKVLVADVTNGG
jgi:predicted transcriptional regulator